MSSSSSKDLGTIWFAWMVGGILACILVAFTHNVSVVGAIIFYLMVALGLVATYLAVALSWSALKNSRAGK